MSGHTPGPWVVDEYGDVQANGEDVARIAGFYGDDTNCANARLIAAAPYLLAALQHIHAHGYTNSADFDMVRTAITEATGAPA